MIGINHQKVKTKIKKDGEKQKGLSVTF